jgi:hypothetical protein
MTTPVQFIQRVETADAARAQLGILARNQNAVLRGALLATDDPAGDVVALLRKRCSNVRALWSSPAGHCLELETTATRRGQARRIWGSVLVLPTAYDRIFEVFSFSSSEFVNDLLIPLFDRCNPRLFLPYVTSKSLAKVVLAAAKQKAVSDFKITDVGARSRIENRRSRRLRSERIWTDEPVENILAILKDRGQWLQSLSFQCAFERNGASAECSGHISRRCIFRAEGDFTWFDVNVIRPTTDEAAATMRFYAHRARQHTPNHSPRPIVIEYSEPVFRDKAQNKRLVHSLNRLPRANISVIHANPYFRASLVDFTDGSSYEIWVLSENRIIVTPQFRATSSSTERVCDHILSTFEEGDVKDFQEVYA